MDAHVTIIPQSTANTLVGAGIAQAGLRIDHHVDIRTTLDDSHAAVSGENSDWHNGYFIAVLSKPAPPIEQG